MPKIAIRFSSKTSSPSIKDAIQIAENEQYYIEDGFYFVHFDDVVKNLEKLLDIVGGWKATRLYLDGNEVNINDFKNTYMCYHKNICEGKCFHFDSYRFPSERTLENISIKKGIGHLDRYYLDGFIRYLEKVDEKKFKLRKEELADEIKESLAFEIENCPKFDTKKTFGFIDKLPEIFEIDDYSPSMADRNQYIIQDSIDADEDFISRPDEYTLKMYRQKAEIYADVFEQRLRKVLKEFLEEK